MDTNDRLKNDTIDEFTQEEIDRQNRKYKTIHMLVTTLAIILAFILILFIFISIINKVSKSSVFGGNELSGVGEAMSDIKNNKTEEEVLLEKEQEEKEQKIQEEKALKEQQITEYNSKIEQYIGNINGLYMDLVINSIVDTNNKYQDKEIVLVYDNSKYDNNDDISALSNRFDISVDYKVSAVYDKEGYIVTVKITK